MRGGRRNGVTIAATMLVASGSVVVAIALVTPREAPRRSVVAAGPAGPADVVASLPAPVLRSWPAPIVKFDRPVLASSDPVAIDIPAIGVHSQLQYVGLTAQHTMEVPAPGPHYNDAAWYRYSSTPGALGPSVIIGHVDSAADGPSVFYDLEDLRRGDEVIVTRADGIDAVFRVNEVRSYPKAEFPTALVYGRTEHAALRLITCGGSFDASGGRYLDNVIVFASLVGPDQASVTAGSGSVT